MINQIQDIIDDIKSEKNQTSVIKQKYELAKAICKFVFGENFDRSVIKELSDNEELYELFDELNEVGKYIKKFNENNIVFIEEEYRDSDFLRDIKKVEEDLQSTEKKLSELKDNMTEKKKSERKIQENRKAIDDLTDKIKVLDIFLAKYENLDLQSMEQEYQDLIDKFENRYHKNFSEFENIKNDLEVMHEKINSLKKAIGDYESSKVELERLENDYNNISSDYKEILGHLEVFKIHFEANLRLKYDKVKGLEENIRENLEEMDQNIKDSMETIERIQKEIGEKQEG